MLNTFEPGFFLAIVDFIPTTLFLLGGLYLIKYTHRNTSQLFYVLMLIGVISVVYGGYSNAVWKFIYAVSGNDITFLNDLNVYFLSIGSLLIFISVISVFIRYNKNRNTLYAVPFFIPVISILTASTIGYLALLATICIERKLVKAGIALFLYMVIGIAMAIFSIMDDITWAHWVTQILNIIGSGAMLYGVYNLNKYDKAYSR